MRKRPTAIAKSAAAFLLFLGMLALPFAAGTTLSKPENVGISSERLQRLHDTIRRHIEARDFSGAVTLLALFIVATTTLSFCLTVEPCCMVLSSNV